jgi:zinc D-Ala-D-Ala carboxypeptidase
MKFLHSIPVRVRYVTIAAITAAFIIGAGLAIELHSNPSLLAESPSPSPSPSPKSSPPFFRKSASPSPSLKASASPSVSPSTLALPSPSATATAISAARNSEGTAKIETPAPVKMLYGHLPYSEADSSRLKTVGSFAREGFSRAESLDLDAATAFQQMVQAAKVQSVLLMPISGFRSISEQKELFEQQIQRKGGIEEAARWSAPPGHSEHHTGYAIDIADGRDPSADLKMAFQTTQAYSWLATNAYRYGFEQSFPEHNRQGVSFEPWHWRFVTSQRAAQVFAVARTQFPAAEVN